MFVFVVVVFSSSSSYSFFLSLFFFFFWGGGGGRGHDFFSFFLRGGGGGGVEGSCAHCTDPLVGSPGCFFPRMLSIVRAAKLLHSSAAYADECHGFAVPQTHFPSTPVKNNGVQILPQREHS